MAPRWLVQPSLSVRLILGLARTSQGSNSPPSPSTAIGQRECDLDGTACLAIALSAGIVLTTVHMQDYRDVPGDAAAGRVTLPIAHPVLSRAVTALLLVAWSWGVSWTWRLDDITAGFVCILALIVGVNLAVRTDGSADIISSHLYSVSLTVRGCPGVAHATLVRSGFARRVYSLGITGWA